MARFELIMRSEDRDMASFIKVKDVCSILACERHYVYNLIDSGEIFGIFIGRGWIVDPRSVSAYLRKRERDRREEEQCQ